MIYSKSIWDPAEMTEILIQEVISVELHLNESKTKILHTAIEHKRSDLDFIDIPGDFVKILHDDQWHKYWEDISV